MNSSLGINRRKIASIILLILICTIPLLINNSNSTSYNSKTIIVPEEFSSISLAVKNASPYDMVLVKKGIYFENIIIDKPIKLIGEKVSSTIIIGTSELNEGNVITLASNNITISGFTIKSKEYPTAKQHANAINIQGDNCTIIQNRIEASFWGVLCAIQSSTLITQNNITGNLKEGVRFYGGSKNRISNNYISSNTASAIAIEGYSNIISENQISNNTRGIGVGTSYSLIFGNEIISHGESGLYFSGSNNIIFNNLLSENEYGIYFPPDFAAPNNNLFYQNNFIDNINNIHTSSIYNLNSWNNTNKGNYWNNYFFEYPDAKEISGLGIGDIPYSIDINNADYRPLTESVDITKNNQLLSIPQPREVNNGVVSLWTFDEVKPNLVSEDSIGDNDAILGSFSGEINYTPNLVEGKFGNCLSFDGWAYVYVPASPSLEIQDEITIEAWIYINEFKNVAYNNILIQSIREEKAYPKRIIGLAVNGLKPENSSSLPVGSLRGYITTDVDGFNEIASTHAVINSKKWVHVAFIRSLESGLELLVDGQKVETEVVAGIQNPKGKMSRSTYLYLGHDANALLDEVTIGNIDLHKVDSLFFTNFSWIIIGVFAIICIGLVIFVKKNREKKLLK